MKPRSRLERGLILLVAGLGCFSVTGCTLWKVLDSPLEPVGSANWELVGEHAQKTGRHRHCVAATEIAPQFGSVTVTGRVDVEAEMEPWYAYRSVRNYEREVETIFTAGKVKKIVYASDPQGRGGYDRDGSDQSQPPSHLKRSTAPIWLRIPADEGPRCDIEWSLADESGATLSFGQSATDGAGAFEIELPAGVVGWARKQERGPRTLVLQIEGQPPHVIEISPEVIDAVSRDLEG